MSLRRSQGEKARELTGDMDHARGDVGNLAADQVPVDTMLGEVRQIIDTPSLNDCVRARGHQEFELAAFASRIARAPTHTP